VVFLLELTHGDSFVTAWSAVPAQIVSGHHWITILSAMFMHGSWSRDRGTGETYCMPHHLTVDGEKRRLMIAALRYYDTFVKVNGAWLFAERLLYVDWIEERDLS